MSEQNKTLRLSFEAQNITHNPLIKKIRAFLIIYLYSVNLQSLGDHPNDDLVLFIRPQTPGWMYLLHFSFHFEPLTPVQFVTVCVPARD